jgi:hypothetical protein
MPLDEAIERALKAYDRERLHAAPADVVAQNIGYKSANNGAALQALASMRYYGLLERPREGFLAVAKDVESFKFAPDESLRRKILAGFLMKPPLYAELLSTYETGLPSEANLKFELINRGFMPQAAESAVQAFKRSVDFVGYFEPVLAANDLAADSVAQYPRDSEPVDKDTDGRSTGATESAERIAQQDLDMDRIPVRLRGGRRAWLLIPTPFYSSDKPRLKAQIDLLLTEDEEGSED